MAKAPTATAPDRPHTKWPIAIALGVLGSLAVALVVLAFLWPTKTATAHNLPVSIAGPKASVTALEEAIKRGAPGTFDFVDAKDRAAAVTQIKHRDTYGAVILSDAVLPEVLTAPASSAVATQLLNALASQLQADVQQQAAAAGIDGSQVSVKVSPIVPLASTDASGAGLAGASFPMTMGGMLGGVLVSLLVVGPLRRLAALAGFSIAAGLVLALVLHTWFQFLQGNFWLNALGLGLSILATASFIVGCASLLGPAGIGIAALITLLIGNPLAAATTPWQFIPEPWGAFGQYLVPGASNWLIKTLSYFPDANPTKQIVILLVWTVLGIVLTVVGHWRNRPSMHVPEATLQA